MTQDWNCTCNLVWKQFFQWRILLGSLSHAQNPLRIYIWTSTSSIWRIVKFEKFRVHDHKWTLRSSNRNVMNWFRFHVNSHSFSPKSNQQTTCFVVVRDSIASINITNGKKIKNNWKQRKRQKGIQRKLFIQSTNHKQHQLCKTIAPLTWWEVYWFEKMIRSTVISNVQIILNKSCDSVAINPSNSSKSDR